MNSRINIAREYIIEGVVVDRATQHGVRGVRVDVWDRDTRYHDLLGQAVTDEDGAFTIGFDSVYFGDHAPDRSPDVFYRLYLDQAEVLSTFDRPQQNLPRGTTRVKLEIELRQLQPLGRDRVSAEQALKAIDCWHASDFRGVVRQGRDKTMTIGRMLGTVFSDSLKNLDCQPVQPKGTPEREIINQDQDSARRALAAQQVDVSEVKPVGTLTRTTALKSVVSYPVRLQAGDRVTLYEEDGIVKYYTRDAAPATTADTQTIERIDGDVQAIKTRVNTVDEMRVELANVKSANDQAAARAAEEADAARAHAAELTRMQRELEDVRQRSASKDAQISQLQEDLQNVRRAQDDLASRVAVERIRALELAVQRLNPSERFPLDAGTIAGPLTRTGGAITTPQRASKTSTKAKKTAKPTKETKPTKPRKRGPE